MNAPCRKPYRFGSRLLRLGLKCLRQFADDETHHVRRPASSQNSHFAKPRLSFRVSRQLDDDSPAVGLGALWQFGQLSRNVLSGNLDRFHGSKLAPRKVTSAVAPRRTPAGTAEESVGDGSARQTAWFGERRTRCLTAAAKFGAKRVTPGAVADLETHGFERLAHEKSANNDQR